MQDPDTPVELTSVPNDMMAAPLISALESAGIEARVVGAFTAGFFAEAPGTAQVMVKSSDLEAAQQVLQRYNAGNEQDAGEAETN